MTMAQDAAASSGDKKMAEFLDKARKVDATIVEEKDGVATVKISTEGEKDETEKFVEVEGKWIPKDMAREWKEGIAEAKKGLEEMGKKENAEQVKMQAMGMMGMVEGMLNGFKQANDQKSFDMQIQQIGAMMGPMMMGGAGGPPM